MRFSQAFSSPIDCAMLILKNSTPPNLNQPWCHRQADRESRTVSPLPHPLEQSSCCRHLAFPCLSVRLTCTK